MSEVERLRAELRAAHEVALKVEKAHIEPFRLALVAAYEAGDEAAEGAAFDRFMEEMKLAEAVTQAAILPLRRALHLAEFGRLPSWMEK